jgi:D-alanyl-lipoteichoic acid acyltransferase DltB (MBOAT superfamily)
MILPVHLGWTEPQWVAPFGISYFTLILIGYLLDVHWGTIDSPLKNPLKFLTFVGYFPHMTSGPFTRYNDIKDSLFAEVKFQWLNIFNGFQRIIWGLFKVLVISTRLLVVVNTIYDAQSLPLAENHFTGLAIAFAAITNVLYIYMNFSGSIDIILGVSELFGIRLSENFKRPFSATSLSELWRRWHITLGLWVKDYVLYPTLKSDLLDKFRGFCQRKLGKKASKKIPTYVGLFVTWLCVGFWHGGTWKFIFASGIFFFAMIVGGLIFEPVFDKLVRLLRINTSCASWRWFGQARTFCLFSLAVSFGKAESFLNGIALWENFFKIFNLTALFDGSIFNLGLQVKDLFYMSAGLAAVFIVSYLQEQKGSIRLLLSKQNFLFRVGLIAILLVSTFLIGSFDNKIDLMYGNF